MEYNKEWPEEEDIKDANASRRHLDRLKNMRSTGEELPEEQRHRYT